MAATETAPSNAATSAKTSFAKRRGETFSEQVSFIIRHKVKPGHHGDYEAWLHKTITEASRYKGHMGAHVARPAAGDDEYEIAVRFATLADAENWIHSETRKTLIDEVAAHIQEPETLTIKSGIDYWFTAVTVNHEPPPRWKQWLLTLSAVLPLSMLLPFALDRLYGAVPVLGMFGVRHLIQGACLVFLLTYVVMPPYTRFMAKWLSRK